jgi:hypothetical protein
VTEKLNPKGSADINSGDPLARPSTQALRNLRALFQAIDNVGGIAGRWELITRLPFAGNEEALDRWLDAPLKYGWITEIMDEKSGSKRYQKTKSGEVWNEMLKNYEYVKNLNAVIRHYSKDRLAR